MADRGFLRPRSVIEPPQGDFIYLPRVFLYEADTAAGLQATMNPVFQLESEDTDWYWVIEDIEYEVAVVKPAIGMNPAILSYSALVWATQVLKN